MIAVQRYPWRRAWRHGPARIRGAAAIAFLLSLGAVSAPSPAVPKELPETVTAAQLRAEAERFDDRRVVVIGRIQSIESGRGRRGSEYLVVVVADPVVEREPNPETVRVFTYARPPAAAGGTVLVQGTYHRQGRVAGLAFEHFIEAEAILRF